MSGTLDALRRVRALPATVRTVALARFVNTFGSGVVYPFAALYFFRVVGIPYTLVGLGLGANSVATAAGTAVGGALADRYGRRPVMVASMALSAPALAAYALVTDAAGFVAAATAAGLAVGLFAPAAQAAVADATGDEARERAYATLKVASNVGFGSGFVAGGLLYEFARTAVFVVDGATSAVVAVVLLLALRGIDDARDAGGGDARDVEADEAGASGTAAGGPRASVAAWVDAVSDRRVLALAGLNVGFAVMYAQMGATVPAFAEAELDLSGAAIGTLWVLNPLTLVLLQLPAIERVRTWRRTRGLALSAAFWAASFLALLFVGRVPRLAGVACVGAFLVARTVGEVLHSPLVSALASDLGGPDGRGSRLSVVEVAKRLGFGLGPALAGPFFDAGAAEFLWVALLGGCGVLGAGVLALEARVGDAENGSAATAD